MKLYDWKIAPNPRRVRIYLAEKGVEVPIVDASAEGGGLTPDYLDKCESRTVPMLELDDGTCISEASAICHYFEAINPEPPLFGRDPVEIGRIEMWERFGELNGIHSVAEVLRNVAPSFEGRGLPGFTDRVEQIPALVERGKQRIAKFYQRLDVHLGTSVFLAGDSYSMADITCLCAVDFGKACRLAMPEDAANIARWHETVSSRPSAKA